MSENKTKQCIKCKEVKSIDLYHKNSARKDGKNNICKECRKKSECKERVCKKSECHNVFIPTSKCNYFCSECRLKPCTKEECRIEALKYSTRGKFQKHSKRQYRKSLQEGWLDEICSHMVWVGNVFRTDEELQSEMRKYNSRIEFARNNDNFSVQARRRDWYKDFAQELWGDKINPGGYKKPNFIKACQRNNKGLGLIYLIKCFGNGEIFYKIGITSQGSVKQRYEGNCGSKPNTSMKYNYEIIWTLEGDPSEIWDMEKKHVKSTKELRYQPENWYAGKSKETFKCDKDSPLLLKPELEQGDYV